MCLVSTAEVLRRAGPLRAVARAHPRAAAVDDVWEMDDEDALDKCDFRRATELQVAIQRADVEVTGEAGQTRYFSCSIGQHCRDGQVLTVEWVNATAAPTPAQKKDDSDGATQRAFAVGFLMTYLVVDIFF
mgnify:CR=1 FL=1